MGVADFVLEKLCLLRMEAIQELDSSGIILLVHGYRLELGGPTQQAAESHLEDKVNLLGRSIDRLWTSTIGSYWACPIVYRLGPK